jgi:hypothetical protein
VTPLLFAALIALSQQTPDAEEPDPTVTPPPKTRPADREFGGKGSTQVTTIQVDAPSQPPKDYSYRPPSVRPFEMPAIKGDAPSYAAPSPTPPEPVSVEQYRRSYEGPKDPTEQMYESGVKGAFDSAQVMQGPLDGPWTVVGPDGAPLFSFLFTDTGQEDEPVQGAWRDLRKARGPDSAGVIDVVWREGRALTLRFREREGGPELVLKLEPGAQGRWTGAMDGDGARRPVVMRRS